MKHFQIPGAIFGILGSLLLACGYPAGWLAYLVSNVCWILFAWSVRGRWLILQNVFFLAITFLGIYNTLSYVE